MNRDEATGPIPLRVRPLASLTASQRTVLGLVPCAVALILWATCLPASAVDLDAMTDTGLVSVLPARFFIALGLLSVGFAISLGRPRDGDRIPAIYSLALIAIVHATPTILYDTLRYGWAWKHVGVIDYIQRFDGVDRDIQYLTAYHDWPGFFSLGALLTDATGQVNALGIAEWAPPFFEVLFVAAVLFLVRTLTSDRRVQWGAAWLFLLGNWVGQDYFSPQALSFFLYVVFVTLLIRRIELDPAKVSVAAASATERLRGLQRRGTLGLAAILLICAVVVSSHQLTPLMMIAAAAVLTVTWLKRLRWLPAVIAVMMFGWIVAFALPFFDGNLYWIRDSIGTFGSNTTSTFANLSDASSGMVLVAWAGRALAGGIIALAVIGFVRRYRANYVDIPFVWLAICPGALLIANNYGGEIVFRVFLFALPFLAIEAARTFFPSPHQGRSRATLVAFALTSLLLTAGLTFAYYGKERTTRFSSAEVAATDWLYDNAPEESLMVSGTFDYPWAWRGYERYDYIPLSNEPARIRRGIESDPVTTLTRMMAPYPTAYLVLTRAQEASVDMTGVMRAGTLQRAAEALEHTGSWQSRVVERPGKPWFNIVHRSRDAIIFELEGA